LLARLLAGATRHWYAIPRRRSVESRSTGCTRGLCGDPLPRARRVPTLRGAPVPVRMTACGHLARRGHEHFKPSMGIRTSWFACTGRSVTQKARSAPWPSTCG